MSPITLSPHDSQPAMRAGAATAPKKICFFSRVKQRDLLDGLGFYQQDLRILRELGYDVRIATSWRELRRDADLYYAWWWQWGFVPKLKTLFRHVPILMTGVFAAEENLGDYKRRSFLARLAMRMALRHADANIFVADNEFREIPALFRTHNPIYLPLSVDTDEYRPADGERQNFLLTVANLSRDSVHRKCVGETLEAFALLAQAYPELELRIAGGKHGGVEQLERRAQDLGVVDRVRLLGFVSPEEKISLMQRCRVYVSPSRYEGFGLAIAEAMACGAPIVTSSVGAMPHVVGDAGVLLPEQPPEPQRIAKAVRELLDHPAEATELGERARQQIVENFSYARRKREMKQILEQFLRS